MVTDKTTSTVSLSWTAPTQNVAVEKYVIEYGIIGQTAASVDVTGTTHILSNLGAGATYTVSAYSVNAEVQSEAVTVQVTLCKYSWVIQVVGMINISKAGSFWWNLLLCIYICITASLCRVAIIRTSKHAWHMGRVGVNSILSIQFQFHYFQFQFQFQFHYSQKVSIPIPIPEIPIPIPEISNPAISILEMIFDVFFEIDYNYTNKVHVYKIIVLIPSVSYPLLNGHDYMASWWLMLYQ